MYRIATLALALAAASATTGCALFSDPAPTADFRVVLRDYDPERGIIVEQATVDIPVQWFADNTRYEQHDRFRDPATFGGQPVHLLEERSIIFTRLTDPSASAQVALARSEGIERVTQTVATAGVTAMVEYLASQTTIALEQLRTALETRRLELEHEHHEPEPDAPPPAPAEAPDA